MTYVVGINQLGVNAIICDTRVTWPRSDTRTVGTNTGLKSGFLFPGCIYAVAGDSNEANKFILQCRQYVMRNGTISNFWERYLDFTSYYDFNKELSSCFQLLLSTRHSGSSEFFVLDSTDATVKPAGKFITLGSGRGILDSTTRQWSSKRKSLIEQLVTEQNIPHITFPFFYCLWLNEIAQGMGLSKLEDRGVGGLFHFIWQNNETEGVQQPAVYVISAADVLHKMICSWIYRVTCVDYAIVMDNPIVKARELYLDTTARPGRELIDHPNYEEIKRNICVKADTQPFYYFCGFGFSDPIHRGECGFHITTKGDFKVSGNGWIDQKFKALIQGNFSRAYSIKLEDGREVT